MANSTFDLKSNSTSSDANNSSYTYKFDFFHKKLTVYRDGHGISERRCALHVLSENFSKIRQSFSLSKTALKDAKLPSLEEMLKGNIQDRFKKPLLMWSFFDISKQNCRLNFFEDEDESSDEEKVFDLSFEPRLYLGQKIIYGFAWSCPKLFPEKKADFDKAKDPNMKECDTFFEVIHIMDKVVFEIWFEKGYEFEKRPYFTIKDMGGNVITPETPLNYTPDLYYDKFQYNFDQGISIGNRIAGRWIPK